MKRRPELRYHSTQKNYIAIWYSLILHLFMFIVLVNVWEVDVTSIAGDIWKDFTGNNDENKLIPDQTSKEIKDLYQPSEDILRFNSLPEN